MRVALVYRPRPLWPKFDWVRAALDVRGHETTRVGCLDDLRAADGECDLVLFEQRCGGLEQNAVAEMAANRRAVWAEWLFDLMATDPSEPIRRQKSINYGLDAESWTPWAKCLRSFDVVFVKERGLLHEYQEIGIDAEWLDQGFPSHIRKCVYDGEAKPEWDVMVVGSRAAGWLHRRRSASMLESEGFVVAWCGHPGGDNPAGVLPLPFCKPEDFHDLLPRAACVLNVDYRCDLEGYCSDRIYLLAGGGVVRSCPRRI